MMRKLAAITCTLALLGIMSGCGPRMIRHAVGAAIVTAAVVGTAHAIAHHDAHYHYHNCGCPRQWEGGNWVYYYHGGWEYYDPHARVWYRYH